MVSTFLGWMGFDGLTIMRMVEGDLKEFPVPGLQSNENPITPRTLMQSLGTDWGRGLVDPDLWVKAAMAKALRYLAYGRSVVIDDLRFPNELKAIFEAGGLTLRIIRKDVPIVKGPYEALLEDNYMRRFNYIIENDGTLEELHAKARWLAHGLAK